MYKILDLPIPQYLNLPLVDTISKTIKNIWNNKIDSLVQRQTEEAKIKWRGYNKNGK